MDVHAHTYRRPAKYEGLGSLENRENSLQAFITAQHDVLELLEDMHIARFASALKSQTRYNDNNLPTRTVVERRIELPSGISVAFYVGSQEGAVHNKDILFLLENALGDVLDDKASGTSVPYVRKIGEDYFIRADRVLNLARRWASRKSDPTLKKEIRLEPKSVLYADKRLALPVDITTEGLERLSLSLWDEQTYYGMISSQDPTDAIGPATDYLRAREFHGDISRDTIDPFIEALREEVVTRNTPWVQIGDVLLHVPMVETQKRRYDAMVDQLFSDDEASPGELVSMVRADDVSSREVAGYRARFEGGHIYIAIDDILEKIRKLKSDPKLNIKSSRWDPIRWLYLGSD